MRVELTVDCDLSFYGPEWRLAGNQVEAGSGHVFDNYIAFHARTKPEATAVVAVDGSVTFERFDHDINRAMFELIHLSAGPGESASVAVASPYLKWVLVLALARLGIATASSSDKGSKQLIGDGSKRSGEVTQMLDGAAIARIFGGSTKTIRRVRPDPQALARVLQSSGTTGEQKRVGMSWEVIDAAIRNAFVAYGAPKGPWLASTGIDTILGLVVTLACWAAGNPAVLGIYGRLRPDQLAIVRPRLIALVPDQLQRLLDDLPEGYEKQPLRIISGGGPVPPPLAKRTRLHLTSDLLSVYGASETGAVAVADLALLEQEAGTAGYILPMVEVEIVNELGKPQPSGVQGLIRVRSNRVVDHFFSDEQKNADRVRERWFHSGDLGRLREDGLLMIDGRVDDIMNLAGHKILPGWVEKAALSYTEVADAAAFAVPDDYGLDRCWLAVVTKPGFTDAQLSAALGAQLDWLTQIKLLKLDQLPRNRMGKVQRDQLRAFVINPKRPS